MISARARNLVLVAATVALALTSLLIRGREGLDGLFWGSNTVLGGQWVLDPHGTVNLGVYDPDATLASSSTIALDHVFVSWLDVDSAKLRGQFDAARRRNRWLMVTVEPWVRDPAADTVTLFVDIRRGRYDPEIDNVCAILGRFQFPILLRWGHEMETPTGRYPWAQADAPGYVDAYRYVIGRCRDHVRELYTVWSPRGDKGLERYFPGRAYADYVGLSVYSLPASDRDIHGRVRSFAENFGEKYARVRPLERPVMIAELGVEGSAKYRQVWLDEMRRSLVNFPNLKTIVYFNAQDLPGAWEVRYGIPDWRVPPGVFR